MPTPGADSRSLAMTNPHNPFRLQLVLIRYNKLSYSDYLSGNRYLLIVSPLQYTSTIGDYKSIAVLGYDAL